MLLIRKILRTDLLDDSFPVTVTLLQSLQPTVKIMLRDTRTI